ncbi:MAG: helix-turn-helix domain-containing protein [Sphingomonadales bacterium]|nr:helix-turn-helix domain-containing protein [Sphingomonadales bacterium]
MITPAQCRAARGLLKWTQEDLAANSDVGIMTIRTFETDKASPRPGTIKLLKIAFEAAGVEFLTRDGQGVGVQFGAGGGAG